MITIALLLLQVYSDWRDTVQPEVWRLVEDSPVRQLFVREDGNLQVRIETDGASVFQIWGLNCAARSAQAVVNNRYGENNLKGVTMPSPPGVLPLPHGPGSEVEAVATALCPSAE